MSPSPVPATIGRFRVESVLGTGGMGAVYKAFDPTLKRTVAVKTVLPGINSPDALQRLLFEAQACAGLHHAHIVTIYDAGEIDGGVYVAMEYLVGENLDAALKHGTLGLADTLDILIQVTDALAHAHAAGVVHRDIKPGNIYRQSDGAIKIVDFGLARMAQSEQLTAVGVILGTPAYASPEQLRGEKIDARTDIYATGVVAYEMIAGRRPFVGAGDIGALFYKVIHEPVPPMNVPASRTFPELEAIVQKAMAKDPVERYQTAAALRDDFRRFLDRNREQIASAVTDAEQATVVVVPTVSPRPPSPMAAPAPPSSSAERAEGTVVVAQSARPNVPPADFAPPADGLGEATVVVRAQPVSTQTPATIVAAARPVPPAPAPAPPPPVAVTPSPLPSPARAVSSGRPMVQPPVLIAAVAVLVAVLVAAGWWLVGRTPAAGDASPNAGPSSSPTPAAASPAPVPPMQPPPVVPADPPPASPAAASAPPAPAPAPAEVSNPVSEPPPARPSADRAPEPAEPQRAPAPRRTDRAAASAPTPAPVSPATRAAYDRRCTQLNDRASVGETLSADDRAFLIRNCGSSRKGTDAPR